jgi:hypothetical protein
MGLNTFAHPVFKWVDPFGSARSRNPIGPIQLKKKKKREFLNGLTQFNFIKIKLEDPFKWVDPFWASPI